MQTLADLKRCAKCSETKLTTEFPKASNRRDGLYPYCKVCKNTDDRQRRIANGDEVRAKQRESARRRGDKVREQKRISYARHRDKSIPKFREYYARNREKILDQMREAYRRDPTKSKEHSRTYRQNHLDRLRLYGYRHYRVNKPRYQELSRAWHKAHPGYAHRSWEIRRARKRQAPGTHTIAEWRRLCTWFGQVCLCCGASGPLTKDHVVPLSRGGSDYIANLQPLCRSCNSSKLQRTIDYRDPAVLSAFFGTIC